MVFLQQYGIIIDQETPNVSSTCQQGEVDFVMDAVLKKYFRTGTMPKAAIQTYVDLAMECAQEFEDAAYNKELLREIAESGAKKALDPHYRYIYRFVFNGFGHTVEFEGTAYHASIVLFVEWRRYIGSLQVNDSAYWAHPQTIFRTDLAEGYLAEQRPPATDPNRYSNRSIYEIPTVLWGEINRADTKDNTIRVEKNAEGKLFEYDPGTKIISPIEARRILSDNFSVYERYADCICPPYSIRQGLYGECPDDIPRSDPFNDPPAWSRLVASRHLDTMPQSSDPGNNMLQPECCTQPSSSYLETLAELWQNRQSQEQGNPC